MNFFINTNSDLPILKLPTTDLSEQYDITNDMWENCAVTFSMYNSLDGTFYIANEPGKIIVEEKLFNEADPYDYFVIFQFRKNHVRKHGVYVGEFKIDFINNPNGCGTLTIPVNETLHVFIKDSITKTEVIS